MAGRKKRPMTGVAYMRMPDGSLKKWATVENLLGAPEERVLTLHVSEEESEAFIKKMAENVSESMAGRLSSRFWQTDED